MSTISLSPKKERVFEMQPDVLIDTERDGQGDLPTEEMLVNMGPQHPATHGVLRCVIQLDGENIVICPGVCGAGQCGAFYRARAWQADLACQNCGFLEHEKPWTPPEKKDGHHLANLLAMISLEAARKRRG